MNRIDNIIADLEYILENLRLFAAAGNCNTCASRSECKYCPQLGQQVRYNCPFYKR